MGRHSHERTPRRRVGGPERAAAVIALAGSFVLLTGVLVAVATILR